MSTGARELLETSEVLDFAPGDQWIRERDWSGLTVRTIRGLGDPCFESAYADLWREFGACGGMEQRHVLERRFTWDLQAQPGPIWLHYEMLRLELHGERAALRDHGLILSADPSQPARPAAAVVFLSHAWVAPSHRRRGLGGWLRALPLVYARRALRSLGANEQSIPITLVAEMEHPSAADPMSFLRLHRYGRAGFRQLDPDAARYAQPDFRSAEEIEQTGAKPLPLRLVLRRVGRESETTIDRRETRALVDALYAFYAAHACPAAMTPVRDAAQDWTGARDRFQLLELPAGSAAP